MLERPYEDLVTEEIIDSLPGPKIEVVEPEDDPDKVKVEGVSMDTESTEPTQMEVEGGSVDPVSTKDEVIEDVEMDDSHAQSAPFKKPRTSADPPTTEVKEESGSVDPESFVGLGEDQNVFDNLPKISEEEVQEAMRKQGVWGKQSTYVDPRDIDMARTFSSAPDASKASEINDEFVATSKKGEEQLDIRSLEEFKTFMEKKNQTLERSSPTFALANQKHGPNTGFYHDGGRTDPIYWFKLQHMIFRDTRTSMTHPTQKYGCTETGIRSNVCHLCMRVVSPRARSFLMQVTFGAQWTMFSWRRVPMQLREQQASGESYSRSSNLFEVLEVLSKTPCCTTSFRAASTGRRSAN